MHEIHNIKLIAKVKPTFSDVDSVLYIYIYIAQVEWLTNYKEQYLFSTF